MTRLVSSERLETGKSENTDGRQWLNWSSTSPWRIQIKFQLGKVTERTKKPFENLEEMPESWKPTCDLRDKSKQSSNEQGKQKPTQKHTKQTNGGPTNGRIPSRSTSLINCAPRAARAPYHREKVIFQAPNFPGVYAFVETKVFGQQRSDIYEILVWINLN